MYAHITGLAADFNTLLKTLISARTNASIFREMLRVFRMYPPAFLVSWCPGSGEVLARYTHREYHMEQTTFGRLSVSRTV